MNLEEILKSVSDVLFPAHLGRMPVGIDSRDADGDTPLHVITRRRDRESVEILINAGADVNAVGDMGETPLHAAVISADIRIIKILLAAGANRNIRCEFGDTPYERALKKGGAVEAVFDQNGT